MNHFLAWVTFLAVLSLFSNTYAANNFICYFPNWGVHRLGIGQFTADNIDANICTHYIYGYAVLDPVTYKIKVGDSWADIDNLGYSKVVGLKTKNPNAKAMISLGGWIDSTDGTGKYSSFLASTTKINAFVASAVAFLQQYKFDGLDLDYEYPTAADKVGFKNLIVALKTAFQPYGYLLSAAVSADASRVDEGYDVVAMNTYLDFVNLMTYDFHGSWELFVYHHSPLIESPDDSPGLNADYAVTYWESKGLDRSKINMGIPLHGRTWTLSSSDTAPFAPAITSGGSGPYTNARGFLAYYEICSAIQNDEWLVTRDPTEAVGPYAVSSVLAGRQTWVGYDDPAMAIVKTNYILSKGLGGAMVWDISLDDFRNTCGDGINPVMSAIAGTLNGTFPTSTATPVTTTASPDIVTSTTDIIADKAPSTSSSVFVCPIPDGFFPDPTSCSNFYSCADGAFIAMKCPNGLFFDPIGLVCLWDEYVICSDV